MKIEFDSNNPTEVKAVHELSRSLLGIALTAGYGGAPAAAPAPAPTKAAAPSAPVASAPAAASTTETPTATAPSTTVAATPPDSNVVDLAAAMRVFQDYVKANKPAAAKAKLAEFGFPALKDIPPEKLGEFVNLLQAA